MITAIVDPGSGCPCVTIGAAAGTLLAALAFVSFGAPASMQRSASSQHPEARFGGYDAWDLEDFLRRGGPEARDLFRRELLWHVGFAMVFGTGLALLLAGTWGRVLGPDHSWLAWLALIPAVAGTGVAVAESVLLYMTVNAGTEGMALRRRDLIGPASSLSGIKWVLVGVSLVGILAGALTLAFAGANRF